MIKTLNCFEKIADLTDLSLPFTKWRLTDSEAAFYRLAVMICRCCYDVDEVNDVISIVIYP